VIEEEGTGIQRAFFKSRGRKWGKRCSNHIAFGLQKAEKNSWVGEGGEGKTLSSSGRKPVLLSKTFRAAAPEKEKTKLEKRCLTQISKGEKHVGGAPKKDKVLKPSESYTGSRKPTVTLVKSGLFLHFGRGEMERVRFRRNGCRRELWGRGPEPEAGREVRGKVRGQNEGFFLDGGKGSFRGKKKGVVEKIS